MKAFHFMSFGCKVNRYDGQRIVEELQNAGWTHADRVEGADLVVVNCCVVTGRSAGRCRRYVRSAARRAGGARLFVTGCHTPEDRDRMAALSDRVNIVEPGHGVAAIREYLSSESSAHGVRGLIDRTRAYVKIQDGCDLHCAYCIIPSIRGNSRSRPRGEILSEVSTLLEAGYSELVLCGIRLGGFRDGTVRLEHLVQLILDRSPGRFRLRLSSLNPSEVTPGLLRVMSGDDRVAPHLHLPLQSGDDGTLKRMKRPYIVESFLHKLDEVRAALPDPAISTDFMVGFPGEDLRSFERSLRTLEATGAARVHVFPYSVRQGTVAADLPQVADKEKTARAAEARRMAALLKERYDLQFIGAGATIIVESRKPLRGLTSRYQRVEIDLSRAGGSRPAAGTFVPVTLDSYEGGTFSGRMPGVS